MTAPVRSFEPLSTTTSSSRIPTFSNASSRRRDEAARRGRRPVAGMPRPSETLLATKSGVSLRAATTAADGHRVPRALWFIVAFAALVRLLGAWNGALMYDESTHLACAETI